MALPPGGGLGPLCPVCKDMVSLVEASRVEAVARDPPTPASPSTSDELSELLFDIATIQRSAVWLRLLTYVLVLGLRYLPTVAQ